MDNLISNPKLIPAAFIVAMVLCLVVRFGAPAVGVTLPDPVNDMLDKAAVACFVGSGVSAGVTVTMQKKVDAANQSANYSAEETHTLNESLRRLSNAVSAFATPHATVLAANEERQENTSLGELVRVNNEIQHLVLK